MLTFPEEHLILQLKSFMFLHKKFTFYWGSRDKIIYFPPLLTKQKVFLICFKINREQFQNKSQDKFTYKK